jgi:ATP-dependent helicase/nuclease subunit A
VSKSPYALERNVVVAASAGTGKTHALVGVMLNLLLGATADDRARLRAPVPARRIVATTFSRKAAVEMRSRVTVELETMADPRAKSVYDAWIAEALASLGAPAWLPNERSERARAALARISELRVLTLHAFAMSIVRAYPLEAGWLPGVEILTESEDLRLSELVVERAIVSWLETHGDDARAIFDAVGSFAALVTLVRAVLAQVSESGYAADDLLLPENDAPRVERDTRELVRLASAIAAADAAFDPARALVTAACGTDEAALARAAGELAAADYRKRTDAAERFRAFRNAIPGASNADRGVHAEHMMLRRSDVTRIATAAKALLASCAIAIREEKRAKNVVGFSDVLSAARTILLEHPDVRKEAGREIDTLLVDEVQDTSRIQRDLVVLLRADGARSRDAALAIGSIARRGLFVVGDRKQSIYGFRGADVAVFAELAVGLAGEEAERALCVPPGLVFRPNAPIADFVALKTNRRGEPELLSFANALSERMFAPEQSPAAPYEIAYSKETEDLAPPNGAHAPGAARVAWLRPKTENASARMDDAVVCAAAIERIKNEAVPIRRTGKAPTWKDFAVLALTNDTLEKTAFALARRGIPYVVAGRGFYRAREVMDLALMLDLLVDPGDRHALLGVLRGPFCGAHDETVVGLTDPRWGLRRVDARFLEGPRASFVKEADRARVVALRDVVSRLSRVVDALGPGRALREAIRALDFEETLALLPRGAERVANVRKLCALADEATDARTFAAELAEAVDRELAESDAATFSEDDDAVRLLTAHVSKGLDFPIVVIPEAGATLIARPPGVTFAAPPDVGDDAPTLAVRFFDERGGMVLSPPSFIDKKASAARRERTERQRLVYVAATRASDRMIFVGSPKKNADDTAMSAALASIAEAQPELLEVRDEEVEADAEAEANANANADADANPNADANVDAGANVNARRPRVRSLTIAPTALSDFAHCPRRFHLVHDVGLPEFRVRAGKKGEKAEDGAPAFALDARREGTLLHAVLERVDADAFGAVERAEAEVLRVAQSLGIEKDEPHHAFIAGRATRFLTSTYAARIAKDGAELLRELPFLIEAADGAGPRVLLRGTMDLVVRWKNGDVDVIDYKRARGPDPAPYAFQLDVYALAVQQLFAVGARTGLVFLGGKSAEPVFRAPRDAATVTRHLASLGDSLTAARWSQVFPRVPVDACHEIVCGYVGRCHPSGTDE